MLLGNRAVDGRRRRDKKDANAPSRRRTVNHKWPHVDPDKDAANGRPKERSCLFVISLSMVYSQYFLYRSEMPSSQEKRLHSPFMSVVRCAMRETMPAQLLSPSRIPAASCRCLLMAFDLLCTKDSSQGLECR